MVLKEAWKTWFFQHLRQGKTVGQSAKLSKVGMDKILNERRKNEDFDIEIENILSNRRRTKVQW